MFKTVEIEIDDDSLAYEYFDAVNARGSIIYSRFIKKFDNEECSTRYYA